MGVSSGVIVARILFTLFGCTTLVVLVYTVVTDGSPFRKELLTPWMTATLVDFYINVVPIAVFVIYKESSILTATIWVVLLICFGSIATCAYVVLQLCQLSSRDPSQYLFYNVVQKNDAEDDSRSKCCSALVGRVAFSLLGFLMSFTLVYTILTDGSPFRKELLTPWMVATLIDFYVNVIVLSTWVAHKETTWLGSLLWIILLICFGSVTTCVYIVIQLFKVSSEDPIQVIFLEPRSKQIRTTIF